MWNATMYNTTKLTVPLHELVQSGVKIWDFDYPSFYTGEEKAAFEQKVIDHYYFREIGHETVGRFLHAFRTRIREIMPYYIQLYKSVEIMEGIKDPFGNVDVTETFEQTIEGQHTDTEAGTASSTDTRTSNVNNQHIFANTPGGHIDNIDDHMSEASKDTTSTTDNADIGSQSEVERTGTNSQTVRHTFTKRGNQGVNTYAHDMIEFRQSFINVDMQIINELNDLFLGVY